MSPTSSLSSKSLLSSFKGNSTTSLMNMSDDMDGRTRNAKAQKRHREKQKARVKALEESVQVLTAQLEDARRQLGQLPYPPGPSRMPIGTHSPEFAQLQNENSYLRDENSDLRRQLYTLRVTYGQENPGGGQMPSPPPRHGSGQGRSNTNPSGTNAGSEQNNNDPYRNSGGNGNRSRVLSASSAPTASPYVSSSSFPADLRAHSLSNNNNNSSNNSNSGPNNRPQQIESNYPVRYEGHMYPPTAPPPHALPRSQMYNVEGMQYGGRGGEGGENMPWGPESGPPPFAGGMGYPPVNFHENNSSNAVNEPWRQEH
ncbi:uncharacterized protein I303_108044 [Kwoniella dejecticola CBS 10117]|uniref:BZIP domain-containing protein n=1 Tax=Kwoniella dejecticola CBS 10117 TaxID=1296121 RepID=A0A1A5ZWD6_9TREE|nr:uncharacterized protein I303_08035 [Kwoniella dejecticola CBS 10117]OBR82121.1 hypothetical protein I303_08035 [Kwoniella dejecticola CBS 10117]